MSESDKIRKALKNWFSGRMDSADILKKLDEIEAKCKELNIVDYNNMSLSEIYAEIDKREGKSNENQ